MKVLLVNSLYAPDEIGGAETSVRLLAGELRRKGVDVAVAATALADREGVVDGIPVYYTNTPNRYWLGAAKTQGLPQRALWHLRDAYNARVDPILRNIVRRENPDIVHTHNLSGWSTYAWTLARSENRRVVHTIRDHYLLCARSTMFKGGSNCVRPCTLCRWHGHRKKRGQVRLDAVTGVSEYILRCHRAHARLPEAGAYVRIPNGVEVDSHRHVPAASPSMLTFGYVGALAPHKGIEVLLKVFVQSAVPRARLCVFGSAPSPEYERGLRNRFESSAVVFCGRQEASRVYPQIDVLVVPSLCHEAFGRVVIEAYSYGVPVLAANRGGLPEIVKDGVTGFLFDPDMEPDLESKLRKLASTPELVATLGRSCRAESESYTSDLVATSYLNLYQEVLK